MRTQITQQQLYRADSHGNIFLFHTGTTPLPFAEYAELLDELQADTYIFLDTTNTMHVLERDGSTSAMCGNGLRTCVAYSGQYSTINTASGPITGQTHYLHKSTTTSAIVTTKHPLPSLLQTSLPLAGGVLNSGEPHIVFENLNTQTFHSMAQINANPTKALTPALAGTWNTNLLENIQTNEHGTYAHITTFERGVNRLTKSCGTGALASATYLKSQGYPEPYALQSEGGISWISITDTHASLTGHTTFTPLSLHHEDRNITTHLPATCRA